MESARIMIRMLHIFVCSYLQYSAICARLLRQAVRAEFKTPAMERRDDVAVKMVRWEGGRMGEASKSKKPPESFVFNT